ncbi:MAG: hypothetical protein U0869_15115 [Chloroflexota bacterium]
MSVVLGVSVPVVDPVQVVLVLDLLVATRLAVPVRVVVSVVSAVLLGVHARSSSSRPRRGVP